MLIYPRSEKADVVYRDGIDWFGLGITVFGVITLTAFGLSRAMSEAAVRWWQRGLSPLLSWWSRRRIPLSAALVVLGVGCAAGTRLLLRAPDRGYEEAQEAYKTRDFPTAVRLYEDWTKEDRDTFKQATALFHLGVSHSELTHHAAAIAVHERSIPVPECRLHSRDTVSPRAQLRRHRFAGGGTIQRRCAIQMISRLQLGSSRQDRTASARQRVEDAFTAVAASLSSAAAGVLDAGSNPRSTSGELQDAKGSIMIVLATDAPLDARQLQRLCVRAGAGLARVGSHYGHGSGDFIIAFSTANRIDHDPVELVAARAVLADEARVIDDLFRAVVESVEEAMLDSLFCAQTIVGRDDHVAHALPVEEVLKLIQRR